MTKENPTKIPIQSVLANICEELFALSGRLQHVESLIFQPDSDIDLAVRIEEMQDMDLIIQQIADLARAIRVVADVELDGAMVGSSVLGDRLHLNDLRLRLLGLSEDRVLNAPHSSNEVLLF